MIKSPFAQAVLTRAGELRVRVTPQALAGLERYYALLSRWNHRINLTALPLDGFPAATLDRLLFEPLAAADILGPAAGRWFDVGSGGGSPAIPLRVVRPGWALSMVEAKARKTAFLREAVRQLELEPADVFTGRVEDIAPSHPGKADAITVRALRLDDPACAALLQLLSANGRLIVFGGTDPAAPDFRQIAERPLPGGSLLRVFSRRKP